MKFACSRLLFVALLALAAAACQTDDKPAQPGFTSYARDEGATAAVPSAAESRSAAIAGKSSQRTAGRHFIEFRSRYALTYGHSYVVFGRLNQAGQMVNPEVAGLAPKSDDPNVYVLGHLAPVPATTGWTDGDLEDTYRSASWRVLLTDAEYRKVVASIRKLQASSPLWHASLYNCNAFVGDIARSMGYQVPGVWLRPQQFITRLREMNAGKKIASRTSSVR
jgi:hypothetical protein